MKLKPGMREKNGSIEYRLVVGGKRYSVTAKTVKEVLLKEQELRVKIATGSFVKKDSITFDRYFEEWIERKEKQTKSSTIGVYISNYKCHIKDSIGSLKLQEIERRHIIKLQSEISDSISANRANVILTLVASVLKDAVIDELIPKNPVSTVKRLKKVKAKASETIHRALTTEEQTAFMDELKTEWLYEAIAFQLLTGMRAGEVCALVWSDIDYKKNVVHITKTITCGKDFKRVVGSPKTESSKRDIPLTEPMKEILKMQSKKMQSILAYGIHNNIFMSIRGNNINVCNFNYVITKVLSRLEKKGEYIEHFTCHAFRDTFATRFLEQTQDMHTLKNLLGHTNIAITMDLYAHCMPNTKQQRMDEVKIII